VRELLAAGAPPNAASVTGSTPLWLAAQNGHAGAALLLCEAGANVRASKDRVTCFDIARLKGNLAVAEVLRRFL